MFAHHPLGTVPVLLDDQPEDAVVLTIRLPAAVWCDTSLSREEKKKSLQLFIDEVVPPSPDRPFA